MNRILLFIFLLAAGAGTAQQLKMLTINNPTSLRGLSVVSSKVIWASGSNGMVGRSTNSGKTWQWIQVKGFEQRDFRDIEAFDAATAVIMAIAEPAIILKTIDGGLHWKTVYENAGPGMFLDAMAFWNRQSGIVVGDPVKGKFFIARSFDEGNTWHATSFDKLPTADSGEACFAASGTNVAALNLAEACFVSGGRRSRFFWKGAPVDLPLLQGNASSGANSIAIRDNKKRRNSLYGIVVGGDFSQDTLAQKNCAITRDGGKTWFVPATPPHGYRSCVMFISKTKLVCCGTSGVDVSYDGGMNWQFLGAEGFHVCMKAKKGNAVFLAGKGKIARLYWE